MRTVVREVRTVRAARASAELAGRLVELDPCAVLGAADRRDEPRDTAADDRHLTFRVTHCAASYPLV